MYPSTTVNWHDESELRQETEISTIDNPSLFMVVSSFDKGPEDLREVEGEDFNDLYGKMYFEKHGQNAITAQHIIDTGGRLLVKRVCAEDSTIANVIFCANVTTTDTQKQDADGNLIYLDSNGDETTTDTGSPLMETSTSIKWTASNITGCKTFDEVKEQALALLDETAGVYPLFVFTDNGRGISSKAIRLIPDYSTSKGIGKMFYTLAVYEGTSTIEQTSITLDPDVVYSNEAYGLDIYSCEQITGKVLETVYDAYIKKLSENLGIETGSVKGNDLVFGYNIKGSIIEGLSVDAEGVDLNSSYGIELKEGSNGEFGEKPVNTDAWTEAIRKVYAGEVTDEVYDVDQHKIVAIFDANLPIAVKEAIANLVSFRKDCVFFRDLGIGNTTFLKIKEAYLLNKTHNRFIADYCTSYQIKDPITKRNIEVTMLYDLAACVVEHMVTGACNPLAGFINGFILESAIKGTINYTPIKTPSVDQKQAIEDLKVNYAIFEDDNCVVQTCYSANDIDSQLSYINNVMAIQETIRAVRTACPKNRYALSTDGDFSSYAKAVNNVLANFASNFDILEFAYTKDRLKASQKIFYASIKYAFKDWSQAEVFDIYAINNY